MSDKEKEESAKLALAHSMVACGEDMLSKHCEEHLLIWSGMDGNFYFSSSNRTWALGAVTRVGIMLSEREKKDALDDHSHND